MTAQSKPVIVKPTSLLTLYLTQLAAHPLRTKVITSGVLLGLQEFLAQVLSGSGRRKGKTRDGEHITLDNRIVKMALYVHLAATAFINGELVITSVKRSILPTLKSAWVGMILSTAFAQKVLPPQLWEPFFTLIG
ncbi:1757_t:CDS:2, partial [Acaulospora colombiana]